MSPDKTLRRDQILEAALSAEPAARTNIIDAECSGDPELHREIAGLLRANFEMNDRFLEPPVVHEMDHKLCPKFPHQVEALPNEQSTVESASSSSILVDRPEVQHSSIRVFRIFVFSAVLLILSLCTAIGVWYMGWSGTPKEFGWRATPVGGFYTVTEVSPGGAAEDKLKPGDRIIAIDDDHRVGRAGVRPKLEGLDRNSNTYLIQVDRDGLQVDVALELSEMKKGASANTQSGYIWWDLIVWPFFLILAAVVAYLRAELVIARLYFCLICLFILFGVTEQLSYWSANLPLFLVRIRELLTPIYGLDVMVGYFFSSRFPAPFNVDRRWRALDWCISVGAVTVFLPRAVLALIRALGGDITLDFGDSWWPLIQSYSSQWSNMELWYLAKWDEGFYILCLLSIAVVLVRNGRMVTEPDQRRRIKWINWTIFAAAGPVLVLMMAVHIDAQWNSARLSALGALNALKLYVRWSVFLVPVVIAYIILSRRVATTEFVVSRGMQYFLAKQTLLVLLFVPLVGFLVLAAGESQRTLADFFVGPYGIAGVAALLGSGFALKFRDRLTSFVHLRLFGEKHTLDALGEMVEGLRHCEVPEEVTSHAVTEISRSLHPESVHFYYRPSTEVDFTILSSSAKNPRARIQASDPFVKMIRTTQSSIFRTPRGKQLRLDASVAPSHLSSDILLMIPIFSNHQELYGMIFLGEKKSQEPYTKGDIKLLCRIATLIGQHFSMLFQSTQIREQRVLQSDILLLDAVNTLRECPMCGHCYADGLSQCPVDRQKLQIRHGIPRVIAGKYRLEKVLGTGGMATVYRATDMRLNRPVAVKVAFHNPLIMQSAVRFEREGWSGAKLRHPNIVTVYDSGWIGTHALYLVMEVVDGRTWRQELAERRLLPPSVLAPLLDQILDAVSEAHGAAIVHRDLKPENLLLCEQEVGKLLVKVVDFGVAKLLDSPTSSDLTPRGMVIGTPGYIAPEIFEGRTDSRSDLFSIGVITFESLVGRRPFRGNTLEEVLMSMLRQDCSLPTRNAEWRRVDAAVRKALRKDPEERFQTAAEMRAEIIPALIDCPPIESPAVSKV